MSAKLSEDGLNALPNPTGNDVFRENMSPCREFSVLLLL